MSAPASLLRRPHHNSGRYPDSQNPTEVSHVEPAAVEASPSSRARIASLSATVRESVIACWAQRRCEFSANGAAEDQVKAEAGSWAAGASRRVELLKGWVDGDEGVDGANLREGRCGYGCTGRTDGESEGLCLVADRIGTVYSLLFFTTNFEI